MSSTAHVSFANFAAGSGRRIQKDQRANEIAKHLTEHTWKNSEAVDKAMHISDRKIVQTKEEYNTEAPSMKEIKATINRLKRRKACGPDEIPMEFYKELSDQNLEKLKELIEDW